MVERLALIGLGVLLVVCGCEDAQTAARITHEPRMDGTIVGYLLEESPPELKSIETWESEYGEGLRLTTKHYEIYTTLVDPLMLRQIPLFMESAFTAYSTQLPEKVETSHKLTVYLFADRGQWERFTREFAGKQAPIFCKIKAGAYCHNGACVVYNIGRGRTLSALGHEGWHQFTSRFFRYRLPSWLDEGVAMLFESNILRDGKFYFEPGKNEYRLDSLRRMLASKPMPLSELVASNPGEVMTLNESEALLGFYSQSYALVRFLREAGLNKRLASYRRLLADGMDGHWPLGENCRRIALDRNIPRLIEWNRVVGPYLFKQYISADMRRIEREYLQYCRRITGSK